jgi:hypothetical protein
MADIYSEDRRILRELAKRKADIGQMPRQREIAGLWRDLNDLKPVRPMVWITEVPWHEMIDADPAALQPRCRDPYLREIETALRHELYKWDHFACDMVVDPVLYCGVVAGPCGVYADYGIEEKPIREPGALDVVYQPVIHDMKDVEKIRTPKVWFDEVETNRRMNLLSDLLDGAIEVRRRGIVHQWHTPWDLITHWYGVEQAMYDMIDRPEMVSEICRRVVDACTEVLHTQQKMGLLESGDGNYRVGSGGMGITSALPERTPDRPAGPLDQWGCGNAQVFAEVSPDMHEEFSLRFERPFLKLFGMTYYGCCEQLHNKIDMLSSIPNLRKISISPRADVATAAQATGKRYVLSFKPNPSQMASEVFDAKACEQYLRDAVRDSEGCAMEMILKDISTVRNDPKRLDQWAEIAMRLVKTEG